MGRVSLISAVGTPLTEDEGLHVEGLEAMLAAQWAAGIDGVLVAGTMGLLQLLREATFVQLVEESVRICRGQGELLLGVGDAGFARTADRIRTTNRYAIDGVVVVTPYLVRFKREELKDYFLGLADLSQAPLFLYDLPSLTGVRLETDMVLELSEHPNIAGIKCSGSLEDALDLIHRADPAFRVIVAKADQVDTLCQQGIRNHLDGVFSLVPEWTNNIARAAENEDWAAAAAAQRLVSETLKVLHQHGVFPTYSALLNARGIPGCFAPRPLRPLEESTLRELLESPLVESLKLASVGLKRTDAAHAAAQPNGQPHKTHRVTSK
jgi:dihydrodipicolinate synthase/N-acetylneuraminate lyase